MPGIDFEPAYLGLLRSNELEKRVILASEHMESCDLCPWECRVNRTGGATGVCRSGAKARVASFGAHHGEEDALRGHKGSGTIFFSSCNIRCQYCQNHEISQTNSGELVEASDLASIMLSLQSSGCHNINLVSPSHVIAPFLEAILIAAREGLKLPIVYNTGGYDSLKGLMLLDGVIDIYMPDMKYASLQTARLYSKIRRYPEVNQAAVKEMHKQVGDLRIDQDGLARHGLLVRHLLLPNGLSGFEAIAQFLANEISPNTYLNLMGQYRPDYNVNKYPNQFPKLRRPIHEQEYQLAVQAANKAGLKRAV